MKKIELASYPKCGNTWLRHLLSKHFELNIHVDIPDFHQRHSETERFIKPVACENQEFGFYKSHVPNVKAIGPDTIVVIYRHPLDVFLSSLNYFYINGWDEKYFDGKAVTVEDLKGNGQLDLYFHQFLTESGSGYFDGLLGKLSNYYKYMDHVKGLPNSILLKYENLYDERNSYFEKFFSDVLGTRISCATDLFSSVDDKTKNSGGNFYWKSKKRNYEEFLTSAQISLYEERYKSELEVLGYL